MSKCFIKKPPISYVNIIKEGYKNCNIDIKYIYNIIMSTNYECRICYEEEVNKKALIHPCACDGTNRYVHRKCLNEWRLFGSNRNTRKRCMECNENYIFINK